MQHIAVLAVSGRMLAQSCHELGYSVHLIDCFNDVDAIRIVYTAHKITFTEEGFNSSEVLAIIKEIQLSVDLSGVLIGSGIETNPSLLEEINKLTKVYSHSPKVFYKVHNAKTFFSALDKLDIVYPDTLFSKPDSGSWLRKRSGGLGGQHIGVYMVGEAANTNDYYQKHELGEPMSALFFAGLGSYHLIGLHHLLVHEQFKYAGVIKSDNNANSREIKNRLKQYFQLLQRRFDLKGLCGVDFILDKTGQIKVLELNARPTAALGLYQNKTDWLKAHVDFFSEYTIQIPDAANMQNCGERIIYAPKDCVWSASIMEFEYVHDIPHAGQEIRQGEPICSISACTTNRAETGKLLYDRALVVQKKLGLA